MNDPLPEGEGARPQPLFQRERGGRTSRPHPQPLSLWERGEAPERSEGDWGEGLRARATGVRDQATEVPDLRERKNCDAKPMITPPKPMMSATAPG